VSLEHRDGSSIAAEQPLAEQLPSPGRATLPRLAAPPLPEAVTDGEYVTEVMESVDAAAREPPVLAYRLARLSELPLRTLPVRLLLDLQGARSRGVHLALGWPDRPRGGRSAQGL
jgi:hypothetical protein